MLRTLLSRLATYQLSSPALNIGAVYFNPSLVTRSAYAPNITLSNICHVHAAQQDDGLASIKSRCENDHEETNNNLIGPNLQISITAAKESLADYLKEIERKTKLSDEKEKEHTNIVEALSDDMQKKLSYLKLEYDMMFSTCLKVPSLVTNEMWLKLLEVETASARKRMLGKFWVEERYKRQTEKRQQAHIKRLEERIERISTGGITVKNTIFLKLTNTHMNRPLYAKIAYAMQHGPHLIFDLDFDSYMSKKDIVSLVDQIHHSHGINKINERPFHFYLSNARNENPSMAQMNKSTMEGRSLEDQMITVTEKDIHDLFPRENLVYLTPDSPNVMKDFDHDATYVIGGLVENGAMKPLTLAKCKRLKIKTCRLPLDKHLRWVTGKKTLTLNCVVEILLAKKGGATWQEAFKAIPQKRYANQKNRK